MCSLGFLTFILSQVHGRDSICRSPLLSSVVPVCVTCTQEAELQILCMEHRTSEPQPNTGRLGGWQRKTSPVAMTLALGTVGTRWPAGPPQYLAKHFPGIPICSCTYHHQNGGKSRQESKRGYSGLLGISLSAHVIYFFSKKCCPWRRVSKAGQPLLANMASAFCASFPLLFQLPLFIQP